MEDIPRHQVLDRIRSENPWWAPPHQLPSPDASLRPRAYLDGFLALVQALGIRRAVLLMGPRRVGKTVLLRHVIGRLLAAGVPPRHVCYVSVDHPLYNGLGLDALLSVFREAAAVEPTEGPLYVLFDEIQHLREWEVHLKALVDSHADVRFVASGSAAAALKLKSRESGAGRFTDFLLPPLSFHEYLDLRGLLGAVLDDNGHLVPAAVERANQEFVSYLNYGGYPELALNPLARKDPGRFVKEDVIDKVLLRDLPGLYGIQDIQELNSLFTVLAFNSGGEVSLEALSRRSHVAKNTLKRYIEYLEAAFLIKVVHRVDHSARRLQRASTFKVYLTNPSMFAALFTPVGPNDPATPRLVETAVHAQFLHSATPVHYARWDGGEVDFVWLDALQRPVRALEVKWTDRPLQRPAELRALATFCARHAIDVGVVTSRTGREAAVVAGRRFTCLPASHYCFSVGRALVTERIETALAMAHDIGQSGPGSASLDR